MNKLAKIGIIGGLTLGAVWLIKLETMSNKLVTKLSNRKISKASLSGITFCTDLILENPTKHSMTITKPVVSILTNGKYITSNAPESKTYIVKPLSTTTIQRIEIVLPLTLLAKYATGILKNAPQIVITFNAKDTSKVLKLISIPLEMKYSLYADGLFYESEPQKIE